MKDKKIAALLAFFLGGFGAHKFYLDKPIWALLYLLFCWTFIPASIAFIECLIYLFMSEESFNVKYNNAKSNSYHSISDINNDLLKLEELYRKGEMSPEQYKRSREGLLRLIK